MKRIAIFASGSGTNAENIALYFAKISSVKISAILCNNSDAFVLKRAENLNIPSLVFSKNDFYSSEKVVQFLKEKEIDLIVLAGFLWLIPNTLISEFPNRIVNIHPALLRIVNIHPALLPKYGGKGMYGNRVHEAVVSNGETETGITIHLVNEKYDEGKTLFQAKCQVTLEDTAETVANKVHELEYKYFPKVIEDIVKEL